MRLVPHSTSVATRLTRMNLFVSGAALILAALAFFSYDLISFRQNLINNLETEAQIVGENSVSAVLFNDEITAAATLTSLRRSPDVRAAVLTTPNGATFAEYRAPGENAPVVQPSLAANQNDRVWTSGRRVIVAHRIVFRDQAVGTVYISATLNEIGQRARHYAWIAGIILLFCMAAALLISASARKLIARPIIALAETARIVSRDEDFTLRAELPQDGTEIAVLVDAFNTMLGQIQQRDAELSQARDELEARVEERTAELQAANRELEAFSYTVAHDLRGPLDSISGIAFLLTQLPKDSDPATTQQMVQQLKTSTTNMGLLIDDLLNFARASTATLKDNSISLSRTAREIAIDLMRSNPERKVDFVIPDLPEVNADPGLMRIVLDNLFRNAWKYSSHHATARIEFGASTINGESVYFVRDDGAGFDPARQQQLFRPFQRLHSKAEFPGTGIGLATVQRILARQGGRIWAEGAVEKGATFYFTL